MTTYKSKAEERRAEWLGRQHVADLASTIEPKYNNRESAGVLARHAKLAALRAKVVEAAMAWWRVYEATDHYKNPWHVLQDEDLREAFRSACAALDKAEKEQP